jgi:hypothetical protein
VNTISLRIGVNIEWWSEMTLEQIYKIQRDWKAKCRLMRRKRPLQIIQSVPLNPWEDFAGYPASTEKSFSES